MFVRRRLLYRERVNGYFLEIYSRKPLIMVRHIATGRFVRRPEKFYIKALMGAETGGGSEPIELEGIGVEEVKTDELLKLSPYQIMSFLTRVERMLYEKISEEVAVRFGPYLAAMLEERGRELLLHETTGVKVRYRHPKRKAEWGEISV